MSTSPSPSPPAWASDPPYTLPPGERAPFQPTWHGACFCRTVQWAVRREQPLDAKYCHCTDCQRLHGAPFQWAAIFRKTDVRLTRGVEALEFFSSATGKREHALPCKVYCRECHTHGRPLIPSFRTPRFLAAPY
ncbi:hypothetical protein CALCODRAFT_500905 [Calocera cornea HHB12733]|uniref:CENP-V/GFA domain-containing protein n=1 Tax=Calocera cornea HHB12733 TaxID=1353952 RepID=A0A165DVU0_9BASI|nr:hypothetical protein CALCODRAFT_500905 [Calocera cornea HHB12733]